MNETERKKNRLKVARYRARKKARELGLNPDAFFTKEEVEDLEDYEEEEQDDEEGDEYEGEDYEDDEDYEDYETPIRNVSYRSSSPPSSGPNWTLIALVALLLGVVAACSFAVGRYSLLRRPLVDTSSQLEDRQESDLV